MAMKILILCELYDSQLNNYSENIEINKNDNNKRILEKTSSWPYMMSKYLTENGADVSEYFIEDNASYQKNNNISNFSFFVEKLELLQPEILIVENLRSISENNLIKIKKRFPKISLVTHHCSSIKKEHRNLLLQYDYILCCSPFFIKDCELNSSKKILFYHASPDTGFKFKTHIKDKINSCSFFGSLFSSIHKERKNLLSYLKTKDLKLDIYSSFEDSTKISSLRYKLEKIYRSKKLKKAFIKFEKKIMELRYPSLVGIKPQLFDNEMLSIMSRYLCTLNVHTGHARGYAANMRMFESASVGTCVITEDYPNLSDLFEPDYEILTYKSKEECHEKIKYCYENPLEAYEIGRRANIRALKDHTYSNRIKVLMNNFDALAK